MRLQFSVEICFRYALYSGLHSSYSNCLHFLEILSHRQKHIPQPFQRSILNYLSMFISFSSNNQFLFHGYSRSRASFLGVSISIHEHLLNSCHYAIQVRPINWQLVTVPNCDLRYKDINNSYLNGWALKVMTAMVGPPTCLVPTQLPFTIFFI